MTGRDGMYRHILIPTDGSELSRRAVQHGLALAKAVGAKVTALTVEGSFDVYTVPASRVHEMSGAFAEHAARQSARGKDIEWRRRSSALGRCRLRNRADRRGSSLRSDHRDREPTRLRSHRDGLARPERDCGNRAR